MAVPGAQRIGRNRVSGLLRAPLFPCWSHSVSTQSLENPRRTNAVARSLARPLWRRVLAVGLLLPFLSGGLAHAAPAAPAAPLVIGVDVDPNTFANRWATLVFTEAFRRLGVSIQINNYPLARRTLLVEHGDIDIDSGRVRAYGDAHPQLVRVEEPFVEYSFGLFAANPALQLPRLEALRTTDWLVEYRRGILMCEKTLKPLLPSDRLSDISSEEQGLNKLLADRTDLYCDLDYVVQEVLNAAEFKGAKRIRKALGLGSIPIYMYLQARHAELAPRLAVIFKKMKVEGLMGVYQAQVAREMGRLP